MKLSDWGGVLIIIDQNLFGVIRFTRNQRAVCAM